MFRHEFMGLNYTFGKNRNVLMINCYRLNGTEEGKIRIVMNKKEAEKLIIKLKQFIEEYDKSTAKIWNYNKE